MTGTASIGAPRNPPDLAVQGLRNMDPSERRENPASGTGDAVPGIASAAHGGGAPAGRGAFSRMRIPLACALIAIALLLGLLRYGFPLIENHRPEVERWVSVLLERPVTIDSLRARWRGWSPELELVGLGLHPVGDGGASGEPAITFDQVRISIDPVESLKSRRLLAHAVTIEGATLRVNRFQDGSIAVAGMQPGGGGPPRQRPRDLARWMLKEGNLVFDSTTVSWVDARRGNVPILLTSARVELSNRGDNHRLSGTFRIPRMSREPIHFDLDASGDVSTSDWSGRMVVSASGIRASRLGTLFKTAGRWVSGGKTDLSIWTHWKHGAVDRARLTIRADGLRLSETLGGLRVHGGSADVRVGRLGNGWSADVFLSDLHTSEGRWRPSRGVLDYAIDAESGEPRLVGRFDHARLADLASLLQSRLKTVDFASAAVETYRPRADLSNLHFSMGLGAGLAGTLRLSADFDRFSAIAGPAYPVLSGYSGHIEIDGSAGVVTANSGTVDFALSGVFEGRFPLDTEGGRVAWQQGPEGLRLDVHDVRLAATGIAARVSGTARFDGDASGPLVNVVASLSSDEVGALRRYIPGGIIKPRLSDWLRRAVRGGRLADGKLLLRGRLADFPFDKGDGVIEAHLAIEDGEMEYANGWPGLTDVSGELHFRGRRLDATLREGRILDASVEKGSISIDGIGAGVPVVRIRGNARGSMGQGLEYLSESPLRQRFSHPLRNIVAAGDFELNLEVDFPLDRSDIRVDGRVALSGGRMEFPNLESGLERITGTLHFNRRGARAESIDAVYLDRPVKLDVVTRPKAPHDTLIEISGRADGQFMAKHLTNSGLLDNVAQTAPLWLERIGGETEWNATIDIPAADPSAAKQPSIRLRSSLQGLRIDLPSPIGKDAVTPRPLAIVMAAGGSQRREVLVRYGDDTRAALELEVQKGSQTVRRGGVRFGGAEASLPDGEGIYVDGALSHLAAGEWVHAWKSAFATADGDPPPQRHLRQVMLDVGRLVMLGSSFDRVRVQARKNGDGSWNTRFDGPGLKGTVRLLEADGDSTLLASFEEVDYRSARAESETLVASPQDIPAIRLISERFIFNGRDLGAVKLSATPTAAGLNFGDISAASPDFEARANGFWHQKDGFHHSEFSISLHSESFGGFLESMGFGGTDTSGGETDVFLKAGWQASPMDFDLRKLNGALHFRSAKGKLLGVKRGVTERIFGLLSVTTFPQRLVLDFTDFFENGVSYDSIEGSFNLENGEAYTNNLTMETDTARVEIAGRTGLVTEDYDQIMTVTPKLTSTLPFAPIWLAEKAFNRELFGKSFSAQYTITGSWADPKVEPVPVEASSSDRG